MKQSYLGIDFGTSGARAIVVDANRQIQTQVSISFEEGYSQPADSQLDDFQPNDSQPAIDRWQEALFDLIAQIPTEIRKAMGAIAINGTSSTVLICDQQGQALAQPIFYDDPRGSLFLDQIKAIAPANHTVISATSSLAKLLWFAAHCSIAQPLASRSHLYFLHQADWLSYLLHGQLGISDYHNALKLGYDVAALRYPDWLQNLQTPFRLPDVVAPGTPIAPIRSEIAAEWGLPSDCLICAGTTDSIAAFLASGANFPGESVTSLGSTLVLKLLSETRVDAAQYGIYSHRLGDLWLVGGASNTGGAVLRRFFTDAQLQAHSQEIPADRQSQFNYYPLLKPGERFPINDPALPPCLDPRPENPIEFLHGLLESMARIEARGYALLQDLGTNALTKVYTAGGGAKNAAWMRIRSHYLQVSVTASAQTEAAYGTALLAMQATTN